MVPALLSVVDHASKSVCTMMTVPVFKSAALMDADGYATFQFQALEDNLKYFCAKHYGICDLIVCQRIFSNAYLITATWHSFSLCLCYSLTG